MSSTNKTANYELSQFVGTDIPSILGDYNGDMRKIDAAIGEVASSAGSSASAVSALSGRVTTVENNVQTLEGAQTVTNQRSVQNQVAITAIQGEIPDDASSENKLATKSDIPDVSGLASQSDLDTVSGKVDTIESIIPSSASTSNKLATMADVGGGGEPYVLPTATANRLGGVKIGSGINVDNNGVISINQSQETCRRRILNQTISTGTTYEQLGNLIHSALQDIGTVYDKSSLTLVLTGISTGTFNFRLDDYSTNYLFVHHSLGASSNHYYPYVFMFNCLASGSEYAEIEFNASGATSVTSTSTPVPFNYVEIFVDEFLDK